MYTYSGHLNNRVSVSVRRFTQYCNRCELILIQITLGLFLLKMLKAQSAIYVSESWECMKREER